MKSKGKYTWLKALYVVPVVAVSLAATARTVTDYKTVPARRNGSPASVAATPAAASTRPAREAVARPQADADEAAAIQAMLMEGGGKVDVATMRNAVIVIDGRKSTYDVFGRIPSADIKSIRVMKGKSSAKSSGKPDEWTIAVTTKSGKGPAAAVEEEGNVIYDVTEVMPQFVGGSAELYKFVARNVRYPKVAQEWAVQGRVIVGFVVNPDGTLSDVKAVHFTPDSYTDSSILVVGYAGTDKGKEAPSAEAKKGRAEGVEAVKAEAVRVVRSMPAWTPGRHNDKPVAVRFNIPVSFRLE